MGATVTPQITCQACLSPHDVLWHRQKPLVLGADSLPKITASSGERVCCVFSGFPAESITELVPGGTEVSKTLEEDIPPFRHRRLITRFSGALTRVWFIPEK